MEGSSYFKRTAKTTGDDISDFGMRILEGQVVKVHFTDDPTNKSKAYVEYDVLARDANGGTVTYRNCKRGQDVSGYNDFEEQILEANEVALAGKLETGNIAKNMNGTMVILAFLDASLDKPIIIGGFPHRKNTGAKKADGIRKKSEFRGLDIEINKDGEYIITQKGVRTPDGKINTPIDTSIKFTKDKKLVTTVFKDAVIQTIDGAAEKMDIAFKSGLKLEYDGKGDKVVYTTKGGPKITVDGAGTVMIEANATKIIIDGNSGKISLTGSMVDVGEAASALAVLGPQMISWLASHTHMGDGPSIPPAPTSPPLVPPPTSLLSTTVKIKA
jgi:hypothetical protein